MVHSNGEEGMAFVMMTSHATGGLGMFEIQK